MRIWKELSGVDLGLLSVSLIGAVLSGALMIYPETLLNYFNPPPPSNEILGRVISANNDTRRRLSQSYAWESLRIEAPIYNQDWLFTGPDSEIQLVFDNSSSVRVAPQSVVVINKEKGSKHLDLEIQSGHLAARLADGQAFQFRDKDGRKTRVEGRNGQLIVSRRKNGIEITPMTGPVKVSAAGRTIEIDRSEKLVIESGEELKKEPLSVVPTSPSLHEVIWVEPQGKVNFSWTVSKGTSTGGTPNQGPPVRIQVSRHPEFLGNLAGNEVVEGRTTAMDIAAHRSYYWRLVSAADSAEVLSPVIQFRVSEKAGPLLIYPFDKAKITSGDEISFRWAAPAEGLSYRLQIGTDRSFLALPVEPVVTSESWHSVRLPPGEYHWRVAVRQDENNEFWSPVWSFQVNREQPEPIAVAPAPPPEPLPLPEPEPVMEPLQVAAPVDLTPLEIENPEAATVLQFDAEANPRAPASLPKHLENPPQLTWKNRDDAKAYRLAIATDPDFANLVVNRRVKSPKFVWKSTKPGDYYWRVQAIYENGEASAPSSAGRLSVRSTAPEFSVSKIEKSEIINDPAQLKRPIDVKFDVKPTPYADIYLFEIATDEEFNKVVGQRTSREPATEMKIDKSGQYFVRAVPMDRAGAVIAPASAPARVEASKRLTLNSPEASLPQDGVSLVLFDGMQPEPLLFAWSRVKHAKTYRLQFSSNKDFSSILSDLSSTSHQYLWTKDLPSGRIFWRVRAEYEKWASPWSGQRYFEVELAKTKEKN